MKFKDAEKKVTILFEKVKELKEAPDKDEELIKKADKLADLLWDLRYDLEELEATLDEIPEQFEKVFNWIDYCGTYHNEMAELAVQWKKELISNNTQTKNS
jgi:hypothetical protein